MPAELDGKRMNDGMLQERFLNELVKARVPVTIYLVNGLRLSGQVEFFDQFGLLLAGNAQQFIFKRAISTIVPAQGLAPAIRS